MQPVIESVPIQATAKQPSGRLLLGLALVLGGVYTLANALKPLHMDDTAYYYFARQIAYHPLDPYGGTVFWYDRPDTGQAVLAPPVLPYWWAGGIRLWGDRPYLWKLWLFPFCILFTTGLLGLFRSFTPGLEAPLLCMTLFAPVFFPSLNLMLDVPALALSLWSLILFMKAMAANALRRACLAGLVAGIAMETKYTAFLAPAAMLIFAMSGASPRYLPRPPIGRRFLLATTAVAMAALFFCFVERLIALKYGESHFLVHLRDNHDSICARITSSCVPLLPLMGGLGTGVTLLSVVALRFSRCGFWLCAGGFLFLFATIGAFAMDAKLDVTFQPARFQPFSWSGAVSWEQIALGLLGIVFWLAVTKLLILFGRRALKRPRRALDGFLVGWFVLELVGYFALSPFLAARRVMGLLVVATLLAGRLASQTARVRYGRRLVWAASFASMLLGTLYYAVDLTEARTRAEVADMVVGGLASPSSGTMWFSGHWGFQFYAERAGMQPVIPGETKLREGDWLVVPEDSIHHQQVQIDTARVVDERLISVPSVLPFRTVWPFYGTTTGVPIQHQEGARVVLRVYRVTGSFIP